MADNTKVLGIRLENEEFEKITQYMEQEGKKNKEFMQMLINLYELQKGKAKNISLVGDIEELESYTNKIHNTFVNIINKLEGQKESIAEDKNKELQLYKGEVNSLENENNELKLQIKLNNERLTNVNNENISLKEQISSLNENLKDKTALVEEYKGKNDMLLGKMKQYEKYPEQIEEYKALLADAKLDATKKDNEAKEAHEHLINAKKENDRSIAELNRELEKLKHDHAAEIETIKEKAEIQKDKLILELKQQEQEKIQKLQEENNNKINEYQSKYKSLLEELESSKTKAPVAKKPGAKDKSLNE